VGSVLATDLDTTVLQRLDYPNLDARVHDIRRDELPQEEFDLIHARLVIAWLPDPDRVLHKLVAALKPGGLLVDEEMDFVSAVPDPRLDPRSRARVDSVIGAHNAVLASRHAFDPFFGRRVAGNLKHAGLSDVGAEGRTAIWEGGQNGGAVWRLTLLQLRDELIETGLVTGKDIDEMLELCGDPRLRLMSQITMAAWGRRPQT